MGVAIKAGYFEIFHILCRIIMELTIFLSLTTVLAQITLVNAYRVLIYSPRLMESHVNFMAKLADVLVEAGHNVVRNI